MVPAINASTAPSTNGAPAPILDHSIPAISEEKKVQTPTTAWYVPKVVAIAFGFEILVI